MHVRAHLTNIAIGAKNCSRRYLNYPKEVKVGVLDSRFSVIEFAKEKVTMFIVAVEKPQMKVSLQLTNTTKTTTISKSTTTTSMATTNNITTTTTTPIPNCLTTNDSPDKNAELNFHGSLMVKL